MNRAWADKNKEIQQKLKKTSFNEGIEELIALRRILMEEMLRWKNELSKEEYSAIPFLNADGYHSKTVAYSIWHIIRIEDVVVNTLIRKKEEILFSADFIGKIGSPIITTGNELVKEEIAEFSEKLDIDQLYHYAVAVYIDTNEWLKTIDFAETKRNFGEADREEIRRMKVVSDSESADWLIDYWCGKNVLGLLKMPLSRHWIMHIEAAGRIIRKIHR